MRDAPFAVNSTAERKRLVADRARALRSLAMHRHLRGDIQQQTESARTGILT